MSMDSDQGSSAGGGAWIAFDGTKRIALGPPRQVAEQVKALVDGNAGAQVLIFDEPSSRLVELDLRGSMRAVLRRLPDGPPAATDAVAPAAAPRSPGRPRLGVVAREVTLLPRHWEWLSSQPGGASVALRKLVDQARHANKEADRRREAREAAYRFMVALAGDEAGFEEASRALFADQSDEVRKRVAKWPRDVRDHLVRLVDRIAAALDCG